MTEQVHQNEKMLFEANELHKSQQMESSRLLQEYSSKCAVLQIELKQLKDQDNHIVQSKVFLDLKKQYDDTVAQVSHIFTSCLIVCSLLLINSARD